MDNEFINKIKQFCNYFSDCNIDYHIKNDNNSKEIFFYDMHNLYSNEILITFPKNSSQTLKFLDKLYLNFSMEKIYWTENWGDESGCSFDRIWIWW